MKGRGSIHPENRLWWQYCKIKYPKYFTGARVVEFGSYNINGTVRDYFDYCKQYVGLDWRPGPGVDWVCLAHEFKTDNRFDTVISASMLEHDPHLEMSVKSMVDALADDGILLLSFGCRALIREHCLLEAPDGKYHPVNGGYLKYLLARNGIYIAELRYTHKWMNYDSIEQIQAAGEMLITGFKNKKLAVGKQFIEEMVPEDEMTVEDLLGTVRVQKIECFAHANLVREIRNLSTGSFCHDQRQISIEEQTAFWEKNKDTMKGFLYFDKATGKPVGYAVLLLKEDGKYWFSNAVHPGFRGMGYGKMEAHHIVHSVDHDVWSQVRRDNIAAIKEHRPVEWVKIDRSEDEFVLFHARGASGDAV